MKNIILNCSVWCQVVTVFLIVCLTALPLVPTVSMATTPASVSTTPLTEDPKPGEVGTPAAETSKAEPPVVLRDHKKTSVTPHNTSHLTLKEETKETLPAAKEQEHKQGDHLGAQAGKEAVMVDPAEPEGMSTMTKVGIGLGAVAVVGVVLGLASANSESDKPVFPTPELLVGKWNARATSHVDSRTYSGVYDLYTIGQHTYDIYVTGDNEYKRGRGSWSLPTGTNTLTISNDNGSTYVGDFLDEDFTTINLEATNGRWGLVLTKQ